MSTIRATVNDQELVITKAPKIASGGKGTNFVAFEFCELWDGYSKTAVFFNTPADPYKQTLGIDDICEIPPEVTARKNRMFFGVFGIDGNGNEKTTEVVCYDIAQGAFIAGAKPPNPTTEYWEQVLAEIAKNEAAVREAMAGFEGIKDDAAKALELAENHAERHARDGEDPILPSDIGAAEEKHSHTSEDIDGLLDSDYDEENETLELGDFFEGNSVPDSDIAAAVEAYMKENPVEGGNISDEQIADAVAEYIAENPIAAGGLPVTVTKVDGVYYKDKTFAEMRAAFEEGRYVYVVDKTGKISAADVIMPLDTATTSQMFFRAEKHPKTNNSYYSTWRGTVTIDSGENVSYSYVHSGTLPNPAAMTINGMNYDGVMAIDFTDTINAMIEAKGTGSGTSCDCDDRLTQLESDVADLLYVPIAVNSFSHNAGTRENGDKVSSVVLSWELNKVPTSLTIEGAAVTAAQSGTHTIAEEITASRSFELAAVDERESEATRNISVNFLDGVYYGCAAEPGTVDSEFILSLTKRLSLSKNLTVAADGGEGKYFWYAYPAGRGESKFNIGGFDYEFGFETISFTNVFGLTKDYYVYKSTQTILSTISVTVKGV